MPNQINQTQTSDVLPASTPEVLRLDTKVRKFSIWIGLMLAALIVAACANETPAPTALALINTATATRTPAPPLTPTASPTSTATPTETATPTLFPMLIEAMRQREYPGSDIVIERELESGVNYRRYYASYLSEGLKIYGLLTIPNGERPASGWPVIVFNHGYIPPSVYRTPQRYIAYVDNLARNGYIVFRTDYRGHDQSEGVARGAYGNPDYVVDVLNAVASIKKYPEADPDRIGMWGHSMGGYITLRAMVISPDIKVGVIWAGVVAPYPDLFARGPQATPLVSSTPQPFGRGWRSTWVEEFGTPEENPDFGNGISANSFLADLSGPIQLHHGTADESVPLAASQKLYDEMVAAGMPVEFYTYEGDNHNLAGFFTMAMTRTIQFFDAVLKP
jgi:fermentation-respiration switch protein FrsA (DUF1100 family)